MNSSTGAEIAQSTVWKSLFLKTNSPFEVRANEIRLSPFQKLSSTVHTFEAMTFLEQIRLQKSLQVVTLRSCVNFQVLNFSIFVLHSLCYRFINHKCGTKIYCFGMFLNTAKTSIFTVGYGSELQQLCHMMFHIMLSQPLGIS